MLDPRQEAELTNGGDTFLHYHLQDRGPFPIAHGYFYDTTTQSAVSTTAAYAMTLNTTVRSKGVSVVSGSHIKVDAPGTYNIQFSAQLENSDTSDQDVDIWIAKNGTPETESNTIISVPSKHGAVHGHTVAAWNFFVTMNRGDYVELYWHTSNISVSIPHFAAATTPTRPSTPSVIVSVNLVSI